MSLQDDLAEAQALYTAAKSAYQRILEGGQQVRFQERWVTTADLKIVAAEMEKWKARVVALTAAIDPTGATSSRAGLSRFRFIRWSGTTPPTC